MYKTKRNILFGLGLLMSIPILGQVENAVKYANTITVKDLKNTVFTLAADSMQGRALGEAGLDKAAEFIKSQLLEYDLNNSLEIDQAGYQQFTMIKEYWQEIYLKTEFKTYYNFDELIYLGDSSFNEIATQIKFLGNLESNTDLKNASLAFFSNGFWNRQKEHILDGPDQPDALFIIDTKKPDDFAQSINVMQNYYGKTAIYFPPARSSPSQSPPVFLISLKLASQIFQVSPAKLLEISALKEPDPKLYQKIAAVPVAIKAWKKFEEFTARNVYGFIEGGDKKDEVLVISAHYDHLGRNQQEVFPGADDNASGVSALLEIAQAFQKAKQQGDNPDRSILFLAFTGEEKGLFGSNYYVSNPLIPLEQTLANLNLDMMGRVDENHQDSTHYIYLIGSDKISMDLHELSEKANKTYTQLNLDYTYNADNDPNRYYYRSDHYNFAKNNIPVIFYFNGTHKDYHQPGDTPEKINYQLLKHRTELVFHTAWELVNQEDKIELDN
ncbi:MAG: M28 family metallopeptidase [Candidatus Cyclobacteriaceae bacterium M3_2C_046]